MAIDERAHLAAMRKAFVAQKTILGQPSWGAGNRDRKVITTCVCAVDDASISGLELHLSCHLHQPDCNVSAQLVLATPQGDWRLARIDWRPPKKHTNRDGPPHLRGLTVWSSIHPFDENSDLGLLEMQSRNLPIATNLEPDPTDFHELLGVIRARFLIDNTGVIGVPEWSPSLI